MKAAAQRYLISALGFTIAAVWLGVGLVNGLACLLVFALTAAVVRGCQQRRVVAERERARRAVHAGATSRDRTGRRRGAPTTTRRTARRSEPQLVFDEPEVDTSDWAGFPRASW